MYCMLRYKYKTKSACLFSFAELAEGDCVSTIYSGTWLNFLVSTYLQDIKTEQLAWVDIFMGGKRWAVLMALGAWGAQITKWFINGHMKCILVVVQKLEVIANCETVKD